MRRKVGGTRPSSPEKRAAMLEKHGTIHRHIGAVHGVAASITYAPTSDLSARFTPATKRHFNQGQSGSCGGHAPSKWIVLCAIIAGVKLSFTGDASPRCTYADARCTSQPGTGPLQDSGVEAADPINAYETVGVDPMECAQTPDGRYSDIWTAADIANVPNAPPANDSLRPTAAEDVAAAPNMIVGSPVIDPASPNFPQLLASALTNSIPVTMCIFVDTAFEDWGEQHAAIDAPALQGAPNFNDPQGGGHYVDVFAHRTAADGSLEFMIWNSWGDEPGDWGCPCAGQPGERGNIWVSAAWLKASCSEAYGGKVQLKAA